MGLSIPHHFENQIQEVAADQHISTDEALDRIIRAGLERLGPKSSLPAGERGTERSYASFFGVAKGRPGVHGSREAVDRYIEELRSEW
jgi:hypothetical protein